MAEVEKLLDEPRTADEILRDLDPQLIGKATTLTPARGRAREPGFDKRELQLRLAERVKRGRFFIQLDDGRYARLEQSEENGRRMTPKPSA